jgi:hypothetical protein
MWQRSPKSQKERIMKFQIENYESMTPEEKVAALEAYEPDMSGFVAKSIADKHASEAAEYKKKLRERMTEDEAKAAKAAEEHAALLARVQELEQERAVNGYVNAYLAMGYEEKLAKATAEAMAKGDTETVFKNQKIHLENREKALRTELLKQTPPPAAGDLNTGMKKEDFAKLSLLEKQKFAKENPEQYAEFYKN